MNTGPSFTAFVHLFRPVWKITIEKSRCWLNVWQSGIIQLQKWGNIDTVIGRCMFFYLTEMLQFCFKPLLKLQNLHPINLINYAVPGFERRSFSCPFYDGKRLYSLLLPPVGEHNDPFWSFILTTFLSPNSSAPLTNQFAKHKSLAADGHLLYFRQRTFRMRSLRSKHVEGHSHRPANPPDGRTIEIGVNMLPIRQSIIL